jgi:hypothetical protein
MALRFGGGGAFAQKTIELVDQRIERFLGLVTLHARNQIGSADFDVPLGDKGLAGISRLVVLEVEADADDALLMTQEPGGLFLRRRLQGRGQLEMHAAHDDAGLGGRVLMRSGHEDGVGSAGRLMVGNEGDGLTMKGAGKTARSGFPPEPSLAFPVRSGMLEAVL